jgi:hypothetical protein
MQSPRLVPRIARALARSRSRCRGAVSRLRRGLLAPLRGVGAAAFLLLLPAGAGAQQFVTDDATLVEFRACQFEAWLGQVASWILPACQPIRGLELTAGIGYLDADGEAGAEYAVQAKTVFRELAPGGLGIGLVAGAGIDPLTQVTGGQVAGLFAYLPASLSLAADRLILHGNLGWHFERYGQEHDHPDGDGEGRHALTWAGRADLALSDRFTLIGELFGEDRIRPEYQVGLRSTLLPDRVLVDLSYGGHTAGGLAGAGWALGFAWTPAPFF